MSFPSTISTFNIVTASDRLNSPSHSGLHNTVSSAVTQIETVIGVEGPSSVVGSLQYIIKSPASNGGGHVQSADKGGTGQTQYQKGDILAAQSSSVLTKLAVGSDGLVLTTDSSAPLGIKWGSGSSPTVRVYSVASSVIIWNKPSNLSYVIVEVQAAGAGGGGTTSSGNGTGGGGAGGYARKVVLAANLPIAASVLAGAGGAPGAATGGAGGSGQLSYFGSILSATGGTGGGTTNSDLGGAPGIGTGGDINCQGGYGANADEGDASDSRGGNGGTAVLGGGGRGGIATLGDIGAVGGLFGGGGGGSASNGGADTPGGAGAQGVVIVTEY